MKRLSAVITSLGLALLASHATAATLQDVENSFNPYAKGFPSFNGLKPGVVIQKVISINLRLCSILGCSKSSLTGGMN